MQRRTTLAALGMAALVLFAGGAAVGANLGILSDNPDPQVGSLTSTTGDLMPAEPAVETAAIQDSTLTADAVQGAEVPSEMQVAPAEVGPLTLDQGSRFGDDDEYEHRSGHDSYEHGDDDDD